MALDDAFRDAAASVRAAVDGINRVRIAATTARSAVSSVRVVVSASTPSSRFAPSLEGQASPFLRPAAFTGLFDRVGAAELAVAAGQGQQADLVGRMFERPAFVAGRFDRTTDLDRRGSFDRTRAESTRFDRTTALDRAGRFDRTTTAAGFDRTTAADADFRRVELRLIDLSSRMRVGA